MHLTLYVFEDIVVFMNEMTTLRDMMDSLPAERRERVEARAQELIAEERTLQDLRKARELTQERMAELLGIGQESVSRLEKRTDLLLSTLRGYVAAMGGRLRLVAEFPDRSAVDISSLSEATNEKPERAKRRGPAARRS